ncbi:MAG: phage portal protein [Prevotellaceae bacterium]|jgi:SPP1 family phage portal protein|nr:phage portal protein [Prevotellaceae bacterium]
METIEEILSTADIDEKISLLKQRKTPLPDAVQLLKDWDAGRHDVMSKEKRPDMKVIKREGVKDIDGKYTTLPEYEFESVNRIPLPLEQDITNIHTSFTVGIEPKLNCEPNNDAEDELFKVILAINKKNKIKYHNKAVVRSWLSEQEVAEYWYVKKDTVFWAKILAKIKNAIGRSDAQYKLRRAIWSPLRGDTLYPYFDETGDLTAFSRGYKVKQTDGTETEYFMTITAENVYTWKLDKSWVIDNVFKHGFGKIPVIYAYRSETLCSKIKPIRERLETLLSNFADAIDRCFFPYLILEGEIEGAPQKVGKNRMIKIENEGKAYYLDWTQTPEMIRLEIDGLTERAYNLTNTPRLSIENLKGTGIGPSGTAFKYTFMGAHLAVENHAEVIGEYLQRRYNFLIDAIAKINTAYSKAAGTIDIEPEIVPFMIDNLTEKIENAVKAVDGGVASRKTGILLAGIVDEVNDELELIEKEQSGAEERKLYPVGRE